MRANRNRLMPATLAGTALAILALATTPSMAEGPVEVRDFVLSHGIENREPVDATDGFRGADGKAVAFARIRNSGALTQVNFIWYYDGARHAVVPMNIGTSAGWRTWSTANLRPGSWRVALVDAQGAVLSEKAFTVGPDAATPVAQHGRGDAADPAGDFGTAETPASITYPTR